MTKGLALSHTQGSSPGYATLQPDFLNPSLQTHQPAVLKRRDKRFGPTPLSFARTTPFFLWLCLSPLCGCDLGPKDTGDARPFVVRARPVPSPLVDSSMFKAGFELSTRHLPFGGFSGLTIDGNRLISVSDSGLVWQSYLALDSEGVLLGFTDSKLSALHDTLGQSAHSKEERFDAEELSPWPGGWLVSFEQEHKILWYRSTEGPALSDKAPLAVELPARVSELKANSGLEAMTRLADGRLLLIAEDAPTGNGDGSEPTTTSTAALPVWVGHLLQHVEGQSEQIPCAWTELSLERNGGFHPTGAALLASGNVLLLERSWNEVDGVRAALSVLTHSDLQAENPIRRHQVLYLDDPSTIDNFEAIATAPGPQGSTWVYLLSDDNFSENQRTLLLQFLLPASETSPNVPSAQ